MENKSNGTTNAILVILLVVVVGFVVWYATGQRGVENEPGIEVNLGGGSETSPQ